MSGTKNKKLKLRCWRCGEKHVPLPGATLEFLITWKTRASLPGRLCKLCCESFKKWVAFRPYRLNANSR